MNSRRDFLKALGLGALAAGCHGTRSLAAVLSVSEGAIATASSLGIAGDGRTDVTQPLMQALNSGAIVDGEGGTFAISGNVHAGRNFKGLSNASILYIGEGTDNVRPLQIENADGFSLNNVRFRFAQPPPGLESLSMIDDNRSINLERCRNFKIDGLSCEGGGIGTSIAILRCSGFHLRNVSATNRMYRLGFHPDDDSVQGIWLGACSDFYADRLHAEALGGSDGNSSIYGRGRGVAVGGCSRFKITNLTVNRVGQGIDLSGTAGNTEFEIGNGLIQECETWGFKFANSSLDGKIHDCTAKRCGIGGFVVTGPGNPKNPLPQNIALTRCRAEDVLGNYAKTKTSFGFGIVTRKIDPTYPRNVVLTDCVAESKAADSRMKFGFRNDVPVDVTGGRPNRVVNCKATGYKEKAFLGWPA